MTRPAAIIVPATTSSGTRRQHETSMRIPPFGRDRRIDRRPLSLFRKQPPARPHHVVRRATGGYPRSRHGALSKHATSRPWGPAAIKRDGRIGSSGANGRARGSLHALRAVR
jgi:hypothetical protein